MTCSLSFQQVKNLLKRRRCHFRGSTPSIRSPWPSIRLELPPRWPASRHCPEGPQPQTYSPWQLLHGAGVRKDHVLHEAGVWKDNELHEAEVREYKVLHEVIRDKKKQCITWSKGKEMLGRQKILLKHFFQSWFRHRHSSEIVQHQAALPSTPYRASTFWRHCWDIVDARNHRPQAKNSCSILKYITLMYSIDISTVPA